MVSNHKRVIVGIISAVISVLIFHQGVWAGLHNIAIPGLTMPPAYPSDPVPPFGVPRILSLCFWGGAWGGLFGLVWHGPKSSFLFGGLWLGVAAMLVGFFVVAPLKGLPVAGGGELTNWLRSLMLNVTWGVGTGVLMSVLLGETGEPGAMDWRG